MRRNGDMPVAALLALVGRFCEFDIGGYVFAILRPMQRNWEFPPTFARGSYVWSGTLGVRVFFVISGFLITYLLLNEQARTGHVSLGLFYKRRMLRIFPVFYAFLLFVLVITTLIHRDFSTAEWLSAASFTRNYFPGHWTLGHLWSVSVEEQFYLLWPLVLTTLKTERKLRLASYVVIVAAPFIRIALHVSPWPWIGDYAFFTHCDSLMFGCLLAILVAGEMRERIHNFLKEYRRATQIVLIAAIYLTWMLSQHGVLGYLTVPFGPTLQSAATAGIIASVVLAEEGTIYRFLNHPAMMEVGIISYGLYIWQQFFLYPAPYPDGDLWWRAFPQNILITFMVAALSYRLIEKPFLKLKNKFVVVPCQPN